MHPLLGMRWTLPRNFILILVLLGWSTGALAQNRPISLHGFGSWAYGKTDNENSYLVGDEDGNYEFLDLSLNISATPTEHLSFYIQPGFREDVYGTDVGLDYAFVEWCFSDWLSCRIGKVKAPFMLYTEVHDVGTLRPFFHLSPGVYQEFTAEAYRGIGLTGVFFQKKGWEFHYDIYGGQLAVSPHKFPNFEGQGFDTLEPELEDMVGGRLVIQTPCNGLKLVASSYTGTGVYTLNGESYAGLSEERRTTVSGASVEYLSDRWEFRSEYLWHEEEGSNDGADSGYVELAYRLSPHWQVAARYETKDFEFSVQGLQFFPDSFFDHEEIALGVNYWVNPQCVLKSSYHYVSGNLYANPASPEDLQAGVQRGKFDETTTLLLFGVQFSF